MQAMIKRGLFHRYESGSSHQIAICGGGDVYIGFRPRKTKQ